MAKKYELDILDKEMREKAPYWLDPREKDKHKIDEKRQAIRDKHRAKAKAEKKYTFRERDRIKRRANLALGKVQRDAQDKADFMQQCVPQMIVDGEAGDAWEAETICELLWQEGESDLYD
jgi:hypothetical protein